MFLVPILLALFLGMLEFSLMLRGQALVSHASREGVRAAALGGDGQDVRQVIRRILGDEITSQATIHTILFDSEDRPIPVGEPVTVCIETPATAIVPDLLGIIGLSIQDEILIGRTVMRREQRMSFNYRREYNN